MIQQAIFKQARNDYPSDFEAVWEAYPKRAGGNSKRKAFRAYHSALRRGVSEQEIYEGVLRYAKYCEATNKIQTEFVMMAATFFGPDHHFEEEWELPVSNKKPEWAVLPAEDEKLWAFAKEHGFSNPHDMTYFQYRRKLQGEIEERLEARHA